MASRWVGNCPTNHSPWSIDSFTPLLPGAGFAVLYIYISALYLWLCDSWTSVSPAKGCVGLEWHRPDPLTPWLSRNFTHKWHLTSTWPWLFIQHIQLLIHDSYRYRSSPLSPDIDIDDVSTRTTFLYAVNVLKLQENAELFPVKNIWVGGTLGQNRLCLFKGAVSSDTVFRVYDNIPILYVRSLGC
jgi:hypothetical protein